MDKRTVRRVDLAIIAMAFLIFATYKYAGSEFMALMAATLAGLCSWRLWATRKSTRR